MSMPKYFDITADITDNIKGNKPESTVITINDASTETARVLVPQMGSDLTMLAQGKVDVRRFSHIDEADPVWMSHFANIPRFEGGEYANRFIDSYLNYSYSVNGRHKKLVEGMQRAVSGQPEQKEAPKHRSLSDRILGRNKEGGTS